MSNIAVLSQVLVVDFIFLEGNIMKFTFYRLCLNSYDQEYEAPLMSISFSSSQSSSSGASRAIEAFQAHMNVTNWNDIAHYYKCW
jgi:hypothetical protein